MRKLFLALCLFVILPTAASASLVADTVSICLSSSACSDGFGGEYASSAVVVSEGGVAGTTFGVFGFSAEFTTVGGDRAIRITLEDLADTGPTLSAGYEFALFDLDWSGVPQELIGVTADTSTLDAAFALADVDNDVSFCFGDPLCETSIASANAQAKADAGFALPLQSVVFGPDSFVVTLDEVALDQLIAVAKPSGGSESAVLYKATIDLVLTTQPVPESSTALLLGLGLLGFGVRRRTV